MFPLPQSDRSNVASQKSLGEDSGHHWTPGIEVAARVAVVALDNRRTLGSCHISWRTQPGKPMGPGYRGESVLAAFCSSSEISPRESRMVDDITNLARKVWQIRFSLICSCSSVRAHWHPEGRLTQGTLVALTERRDVLESDKIWLRALLSCC